MGSASNNDGGPSELDMTLWDNVSIVGRRWSPKEMRLSLVMVDEIQWPQLGISRCRSLFVVLHF